MIAGPADFRSDKKCFTITMCVSEKSPECSMTESEFLDLAEATLERIEHVLEQAAEVDDIDVECTRSGNVLEIEFVDNGSKVIVNSQAPMKEMWMAAKSGGFHYRREGDKWVDTRDGSDLYDALSRVCSAQAGARMVFNAA
jgi:CyaY protein